MFGTNQIMRARDFDAAPRPDHEQSYFVQECFATIQGEGPITGMPAVFVRMWGCNLRCHFCDTDFESNKEGIEVPGLVERIGELAGRSRYVVITGGEPMLQQLGPLVYAIVTTLGMNVQIETAGTVWPSSFDDPILQEFLRQGVLSIVCSPKTGDVHESIERWCSQWKYIISAGAQLSTVDGLPDSSTQTANRVAPLYRPAYNGVVQYAHEAVRNVIWVQPCDEYEVKRVYMTPGAASVIGEYKRDEVVSKASIERTVAVAMQYGYRVSLQTHKYLGLP